MSDLSIPVLKFLFRHEFKILKEALTLSPSYEVEEFPAAIDLATYLASIPSGLVITSLQDKNDLIQIATFLKALKKSAPSTVVKVVVINFSGDKKMEKAIAKLGIQDLVDLDVNTKALKFKLDFWMKSLHGQVKNSPQSRLKVKSNDSSKVIDKKSIDNSPAWMDPLELEDDIWILKHENDCKKILTKWLVRLMGPSPYIAQWTEIKSNLWRLDIKEEEREMYVSGSGAWFYHGEVRPDFVWKENIWLISGDNFDLFYKDEKQVLSRVKAKEKSLSICKNSLFAKTKEQIIIESFDKELVFRKGVENFEDLEGKGKTDQLPNGPLSGKNKTSHLDHGPLSGDVKPKDSLTPGQLSHHESDDKQSGYLKGKISTEKTDGKDHNGPASAGMIEGEELGLDRKNIEHQKFYKGHNPAEQFEAEKKEAALRQRELQATGPLSGASSTDKLAGHYDNSNARQEKETQKENGGISGKSGTDKLKSHYGLTPENVQPQEVGPLSGKLNTNHEKSRTERDYPEAKADHARGGDVLSLTQARDERGRQTLTEERELELACADAKVISQLIQNKIKFDCLFDDFYEDTIIFTTTSNEIKSSEKIELSMMFQYLNRDSKLKMDGNVLSIDNDGEGNNYISIQVNTQNAAAFETFMQLYQSRQSNVNVFMKKVKGF